MTNTTHNKYYLLTIVFASAFLFSLCFLTHNVFADTSSTNSTTINATDDSFTHFSPPYNIQNFNGQGLIVKDHLSSYGGKDNRKTWLKFNLPVAPYKITHAVLRMYLTNTEAPGSLVDVYRHNNNTWSERTITYTNEPAHFAALSAGPFTERSMNMSNQYYNFDVTNAIISSPSNTVTLVLVGNSVNNGAGFADKESGKSPQLLLSTQNGTQVLYHDDYSSNTGWTQIGTQITVDSPQFPNMIKFNNVSGGGGTTEERVYKQLPSTLPVYNWVLETNYMFTSSSIPLAYPVALTIDSSNPEVTSFGTSAPDISIFHGLGTDQIGIVSLGSLSSTIPVSPNVQYYLKLERTQTQLVLFAFSDLARTHQVPGSPVILNFDSTKLPNLNFIQHSGSKSAGPARTITAQITNTTIYQTTLPNGTISVPPSSPTGLVAKAVSPTQINLSWTAPTNNGGSPITGYKIYRSTSPGTETLLTTSGNFTVYNDTGVTTGVTYFYKVSSVNSVAESSQSNEASAATHPVPSAPQNLSATTVSSSQIYLSWSAPSNNGGSTITGYKIERSTDGGNTWNATVPNTGSSYTKYADSKLVGSTTYTYRVSAISSVGTSNPSNIASATTNSSTPPPPPNQTGIIYHDDYSSSTGWTQVGTQITVDSSQFPNMIKFNNVSGGGGVTEERVYKQLPSTLPAYNWALETSYMFTSSSIPLVYPIAFTIDSSNPEVTSFGSFAPDIAVFHGLGTDQLGIVSLGSLSPTTIQVSPNIQYYLKLERTSSQLVLFVFSDSTRLVQVPGSPVIMNFDPTALHNLNFIQHSGSQSAGPARTITAQITNTTIYVAPLQNVTVSAPSPPTGLTATTASSSQINLSWTAPSNNGNSPITGYKIERSTNNGSTWNTIAANTGSAGTTYSDSGLSPSTTYTYRVSAINLVGTSNPSNIASATTSAPTTNGIVLNGVQSTSGTVSLLNQITLANFSAGTGNNRLLVVGVETNNNDVTSVTFGGVQLSQEVKSFFNNDAEFWYLKNPVGTGNIVVTTSGATSAVVGAYSLSGVDQTNPIPTSTTNHNTVSSSPTISITTQYPNSLVLDLPSIYGGVTLGSPTCIQGWDVNVQNEITGASSSAVQANVGSATCSWTASDGGDLWDDVAIEIKASP